MNVKKLSKGLALGLGFRFKVRSDISSGFRVRLGFRVDLCPVHI